MVLGANDMDGGLFGPSTNQKRKIQSYVQKAWQLWMRGNNLAEIQDIIKAETDHQYRLSMTAFDYYPPYPDSVAMEISDSFDDPDREDYKFLGREWQSDSAIRSLFLLSPLIELFGLSEDNALSIYNNKKPNIVMTQNWPPNFDPTAKLGNEREYWDFESSLGIYLPKENKIILYSRGIRRCSSELCLNNMQLAQIVCTHEVAHWCAHYFPVVDSDSNTLWNSTSYSRCDDTIHETIAQWITYFCIKHDENVLKCFETLNEHQSEKYKMYKKFIEIDKRFFLGSIQNLRESESLSSDYGEWQAQLLNEKP